MLAYLLSWLVVTQPTKTIVVEELKMLFPVYLANLLYILNYLEEGGIVATFNHKDIYNCEIDLASIQDD